MSQVMKCPICKKAEAEEYKPFCSKRCADVDLNRWLTESYVVDGAEDESTDIPEEDVLPTRH